MCKLNIHVNILDNAFRKVLIWRHDNRGDEDEWDSQGVRQAGMRDDEAACVDATEGMGNGGQEDMLKVRRIW